MAFLRSSTATTSYVELTQPFVDPPNTTRASTVSEMFSMIVSAANLYFRYELGKNTTAQTYTVRFRNNSPSHGLLVTLESPDVILIHPSDTNNTYSIPSSNTVDFVVGVNNDVLKQKNTEHLYNDIVRVAFKVEPINAVGPVFVSNNLPPVSF